MIKKDNYPETKSIRVFFAVFPNQSVQKQLAHQAGILEPMCGGRKIRIQHLHLTLVFLGNVGIQRIETLGKIMNSISAQKFELNLDTIGYWKHNHIIYLQPKQFPSELFALVDAIQMALSEAGFLFDRRVYKPHITLLRKAVRQAGADLIKPIRWPIHQWSLIQSKPVPAGIDYVPLDHWRLK